MHQREASLPCPMMVLSQGRRSVMNTPSCLWNPQREAERQRAPTVCLYTLASFYCFPAYMYNVQGRFLNFEAPKVLHFLLLQFGGSKLSASFREKSPG